MSWKKLYVSVKTTDDDLKPIGAIIRRDRGGTDQAIPAAWPQSAAPLHPLRSSEAACQGQRSGPRHGVHGATDGAVLAEHPCQPRQPGPVQARQRSLIRRYMNRAWQETNSPLAPCRDF